MILAFRADAQAALPESIRDTLRALPPFCLIGEGAACTDGAYTWLLYSDHRWTLEDVALCGWALANLAAVAGKTPEQAREIAAPVMPEGEATPQDVLAANYGGGAAQMLDGVPEGWTQAGEEP